MRTLSGARAERAAPLLVALLTVAVTLAPFTTAGAVPGDCPNGGAAVDRGNGWIGIHPPRFADGDQVISDHALNILVPDQMYVTNGRSVLAASDGGCKWKNVFGFSDAPSPGQPFAGANATIKRIAVAPGAGRVLLVVEEQIVAAPRPHVLFSDDGGKTWQSGDVGLPPVGAPDAVYYAPSNPAVAYLGVDLGGGAVDTVYGSEDGGQTWELRSDVSKLPRLVYDMVVAPADPLEVWAYGTGGLFVSRDGARTFEQKQNADEEGVQTEIGPVAVFGSGKNAYVSAFRPERGDMIRSSDGGENFATYEAPSGVVDSVLAFESPDFLVASAGGKAHFYVAQTFTWLSYPPPFKPIRDLALDVRTPGIHGRTRSTLEIFQGLAPPVPGRIRVFGGENVSIQITRQNLDLADPQLTPERKRVVLDPGDSKTVPYRFRMPDVRIPLDVFFLVDTSGSMGRTIAGMQRAIADIANGLGNRKIDVNFGLGDYRSYPERFPPQEKCDAVGGGVPPNECESNHVYRRVLDVTDDLAALEPAIESLYATGGGFYDAMMEALYQVATGAGEDVFPYDGDVNVNPPRDHDVPAGQAATFRGKAVKVVLHVADEKFVDDEYVEKSWDDQQDDGGTPDPRRVPVPPRIPSYEEVEAVFDAREIYQVGLSVGHLATPGLRKVAGSTGAVAPTGGVDCDGDGDAELDAGAPLVCQVSSTNVDDARHIVPAIVELLHATTKRAPVALDARARAAREASAEDLTQKIVSKVSPAGYQDQILQASNVLDFEVTFRCPLSLAGERTTVEVRGLLAGRVKDRVTTDVVCRALDEDETPPLVIPPPFAALIALAPPPPVPPPPIIEATSQTQGQLQAQMQAQAQGAAAHQEEEQPQMAFVQAYEALEDEMGEEYAMVSYRSTHTIAAEALFGLGVVLITSVASWHALRSRLRLRKVRIRS